MRPDCVCGCLFLVPRIRLHVPAQWRSAQAVREGSPKISVKLSRAIGLPQAPVAAIPIVALDDIDPSILDLHLSAPWWRFTTDV